MIRQLSILLCAVWCLAALLPAPLAASDTAGEEALRERVEQYMQARFENRWDVVYDLLYAGYKKQVTKEAFLNKRRGLIYGDYQLQSVTIAPDGKSAEVKATSDFQMQGSTFGDNPEFQRWFVEDGEWFMEAQTFEAMFQPSPTQPPGS